MKLDLNCDLGEGEPPARTQALMRWITSANIACGGHAGNVETMQRCVRDAKRFGVNVGAHPGPWSRGDFGRSAVTMNAGEFELLLLQQVGAFERIAKDHGVRLHHIKLHGALYHATEEDEALARRYLRVVSRWWPKSKIYARAGGAVARLAARSEVDVWEEAFADRAYRDDGTLAPRSEPGAVLSEPDLILKRIRHLLSHHEIETVAGIRLHLPTRTLCVHSDTLHALKLVRSLSRLLNGMAGSGT